MVVNTSKSPVEVAWDGGAKREFKWGSAGEGGAVVRNPRLEELAKKQQAIQPNQQPPPPPPPPPPSTRGTLPPVHLQPTGTELYCPSFASVLKIAPGLPAQPHSTRNASATSVTALIFDGTVMAITAYFAWIPSKQLQYMFGTRQSLTVIFLQQGVVRFFVSVILICRFILQLRKFNTRVQTGPSVHIASTPGIRGRLQHIHKTLIEEFGNSGIEYGLETENDMAELEGDTTPSAGIDTEAHITAEEFPWTMNPMESAPGNLGLGIP
ncbi:hypothetical protein M422DRAFT_268547 [Sphaerobolus stellatus SS14]|uniref:Uncharacterized protein n=1 Tax=Sphaerobolus stellatus (strain SS14) TaxID=990650 RepID=A0A0C9TJX7_SPHS4|nr:hypothetical protein M422DRAFT_268547 [Sphaerobolus stellatus SS14]